MYFIIPAFTYNDTMTMDYPVKPGNDEVVVCAFFAELSIE